MLHLYNTATKRKESFTTQTPGKVGMYNCGPTVYSRLTIGNHRTYVFADILRRTLEYLGYEVRQVMNITDVGHLTMTDEDKKKQGDIEITDTDDGLDRMEKAAAKENKTVWEVAEYYTERFIEDIEALGIKMPHVLPRATGHIREQIDMISTLIDKGYAYVTESAVYFDTSKFKGYGELAGQELDEKMVAVRTDVEKDETKRNPFDFRLWQLNQPDHSMQWDSPWGRGYPGWHIECSAMSLAYLEQPIDIHTGGTDHIPVHHTNEIAQAEAATGEQFVRFWMHGAFLRVDGKRMGKSLGNAYTLDDLAEKGIDPLSLRYFFLAAHYRQILNFTWEALLAADARRKTIRDAVVTWLAHAKRAEKAPESFKTDFTSALEDDLNMPKALAVVSDLLDADLDPAAKLAAMEDFDTVLGIVGWESLRKFTPEEIETIEEKLRNRELARNNKQYEEADAIRAELLNTFGVIAEDGAAGHAWRYAGESGQ
ncbi:MAG: Cysteine--tRNA ligase [candidate division WS6 bacterium OLB20]|uniref:Cysteine--tRNA ligase n=1 Tax=candidate division WS6 bacterium OLB20 TaxID=1617426 RepID=A0A136LYH1_9BACT|nr:MAG: Cysteine--tRNA ligase [candidate division WS6 bacterium OLB20]